MSTHETNGNGDNDQKWLDQVRLERLVAEPSTIVPFESSTVSWQVDAPAQADLRLGLNGTPVDTEGAKGTEKTALGGSEARRLTERFLG